MIRDLDIVVEPNPPASYDDVGVNASTKKRSEKATHEIDSDVVVERIQLRFL